MVLSLLQHEQLHCRSQDLEHELLLDKPKKEAKYKKPIRLQLLSNLFQIQRLMIRVY